ncbi:hypothetical protein ACFZDK_54420 [Streptomyces sp. NPDC007901]|uniref:hypothetical protein n=1 Tax=Streptomyces sp. NPDC007901 TaxID=3364785 RepID=UPI0036E94A15
MSQITHVENQGNHGVIKEVNGAFQTKIAPAQPLPTTHQLVPTSYMGHLFLFPTAPQVGNSGSRCSAGPRLGVGGIATATPQTFTVASWSLIT